MTREMQVVHTQGRAMSRRLGQTFNRHPHLAFCAAVVCLPTALVLAVLAFTTAIMLPVSWALGWC